MKHVVVLGGTGYLGQPLIAALLSGGCAVTAVARPQSIKRLPEGCKALRGDVLDSRTYRDQLPTGAVFVHLVGVPHPAPWKAAEFRAVDLVSLEQSLAAAKQAQAAHFVFVSVAHPAPVMKAFIAVRMQCEELLRASGIPATILRPWYILGPGHYWPYVLVPIYRVLEAIPGTRESAIRLGLVTRAQMVSALAAAVTSEPDGIRILGTEEIRRVRCPQRPPLG